MLFAFFLMTRPVRMRVHQLDLAPPSAAARWFLRDLHGIQHRVQQVQRNDHQHARQRVGALQLPRNAARVRRDLV
ncbi:MAG: hypothetical protein ABSH46_17725 [Bryobacteraceae bacterium]|jgi:hypothetical protein